MIISGSMEKNKDEKLHRPALSTSPWLVYTHGDDKGKKIQTFCSISDNESYIKSIPALRGKEVIGSCDNWLILRDFGYEKNMFSLWNVVTGEGVCFPRLCHDNEEEISLSACALYNDVLFLFFMDTGVFYCRFTRNKSTDSQWSHQSIQVDGETINWVSNTAICNGVLYAQATNTITSIFTIEFANHDPNLLIFNSVGIPRPPYVHQCIHSPRIEGYLLESCGRLYRVFFMLELAGFTGILQQIVKLEIWECDLCEMSWVPVKCLGNRAFLLGKLCSTWCWTTTSTSDQTSTSTGFKGNCVYFASQGDETLYSYELKDDTFTFLLPRANLTLPCYGPVWVMPPHQRLQGAKVDQQIIINKVDILNQGTNNFIEYGIPNLEEQNEAQEDSLLSKLPADVILLISKDLHLFDYLNFRASCKTLKSVIPAASQGRANNSFPLFTFSKGGNGLCELRDISRNDSHSITIPHFPLAPEQIEFSKDGWLVVCTGGESFQFFNLFTRVKGEIPPHEDMHNSQSLGFSTCPISSECLLVGIDHCYPGAKIFSLRTGDETWQCYEFNREDIIFWPSRCTPVYHKEAFYFLDLSGYLGKFKIGLGEEASWKIYNKPQLLCDNVHSRHLLECDGELLSVFIGQVGSWVQVFKFDHLKNEWDELETLGNHILFIGHRSSFSALAGGSSMEDRIYLPWRKGDNIVYYSLVDEEYHAHGTEGVMENFYGMQGQSLCCWI